MQRPYCESNDDCNYERCDQQSLHQQLSFLSDCSRVVRLHHKFAQELVWSVDCLGVKNKLGSAGVLLNQIQSKLVILKQMSTQIPHVHRLSLCALNQTPDCGFIENDFHSVFAVEFLGKLTRAGFFLCSRLGKRMQRFVCETDLDAVRAKRALILPQ